MTVPEDEWSKWLLGRRHGGDPVYQHVLLAMLERIRDRVLDGARLEAGMTLADIGTGDGLIAFGAIARVGPSLRVVLYDISVPLLQHAQRRANDLNVRAQCSFLTGSAEHLGGLNDATVDVVTARAVLAYVADKAAALREFYRVLKSGGRISLAEPIFRDQAIETKFLEYLADAVQAVVALIRVRARATEDRAPPGKDPARRLDRELAVRVLDHAAPPVAESNDLVAVTIDSLAHDRPDDRVEPGTVATASKHSDSHGP